MYSGIPSQSTVVPNPNPDPNPSPMEQVRPHCITITPFIHYRLGDKKIFSSALIPQSYKSRIVLERRSILQPIWRTWQRQKLFFFAMKMKDFKTCAFSELVVSRVSPCRGRPATHWVTSTIHYSTGKRRPDLTYL